MLGARKLSFTTEAFVEVHDGRLMFFILVAMATESLYFSGRIVEKVLKQALWELGGHQALAFNLIHGGAAIATRSRNNQKRRGVEDVVHV